MGQFAKWTDIVSLNRLPEIMQVPEVAVTEKIHGTSVRIGWVDNTFRVGGRNEEFDVVTSNPSTGMSFMAWVRDHPELPEKLEQLAIEKGGEVIVYGEWFGNGIQKGVRYFAEPGKGFRIFGVRINGCLMDWDVVKATAEELGLPTVPLLYRGKPDLELFDKLRVFPSKVGEENGISDPENLAEGVVISAIPMVQISSDWAIVKHKHQKFEERSSLQRDDKKSVEELESAIQFVAEFWTEQRLEHVFGGLREKGLDVRTPSSIGPTIKAMFEDVLKESQPEWTKLSEKEQKAVQKMHSGKTKMLMNEYLRKSLI
ncbi:MAG: hypothetical protein G01um101419_701 [Parcubacteria group bacterium Gr01-1014_19]|nr:MAG: hypothetical protein G01um101419_701 [Parcubacteria group bacterium Gr01-1014_19]